MRLDVFGMNTFYMGQRIRTTLFRRTYGRLMRIGVDGIVYANHIWGVDAETPLCRLLQTVLRLGSSGHT